MSKLDIERWVDASGKNTDDIIVANGTGGLSYSNAIRELRDNDTGVFDPATMNNYSLKQEIDVNSIASSDSSFCFAAHHDDYIESESLIYEAIATFIYRGTDIWTPTKAIFIAGMKLGTGALSTVRIYDAVNSNVICEFSYSVLNKSLYTVTPLNNLPATISIFEIQAKVSDITDETRVYALGLYH